MYKSYLRFFLTSASKYFIFFHFSSSIIREEVGRVFFLSEDLSVILSSLVKPLMRKELILHLLLAKKTNLYKQMFKYRRRPSPSGAFSFT